MDKSVLDDCMWAARESISSLEQFNLGLFGSTKKMFLRATFAMRLRELGVFREIHNDPVAVKKVDEILESLPMIERVPGGGIFLKLKEK